MEPKVDINRIIDLMSLEISEYASKLAISKAQTESLAKTVDAQNKEIEDLKAQLAATKKAGK